MSRQLFYDTEYTYDDVSVETDDGIYTHVIVEIWENSKTGARSIGWYATPDTELLTGEEAEAEWPI